MATFTATGRIEKLESLPPIGPGGEHRIMLILTVDDWDADMKASETNTPTQGLPASVTIITAHSRGE